MLGFFLFAILYNPLFWIFLVLLAIGIVGFSLKLCGTLITMGQLRIRAKAGDAKAQFDLGLVYLYGQDLAQDYGEAVHWFRLAADQGLAQAQNNLGVAYEYGMGVPQDDSESMRWYLLAAEQGVAKAQNNLGLVYEKGRGVPQDYILAYAWYNLAAAQGDEISRVSRDELAENMTTDQIAEAKKQSRYIKAKINAKINAPKSTPKLRLWPRMLSYTLIFAMVMLTIVAFVFATPFVLISLVLSTIGIAVFLLFKFVAYIKRSSEINAKINTPKLRSGSRRRPYTLIFAIGMAVIVAVGFAVTFLPNSAERLEKLQTQAEAGDAEAQFLLGYTYDFGTSVSQDDSEAVRWYRLAAEQGFSAAQLNLGFAYYFGEGVPQDYSEAVRWWQQAGEQGEVKAQFNLGALYASGEGVAEDYILSYAWLNLAAAQGDEDAIEIINELKKEMTPDQIAEAQKLTREINARINP